jgi:dihydroorotase
MSAGPARAFGLPVPRIRVGEQANVVVIDPEAEWEVLEETFRSRSVNSWLLGERLRGRVVRTVADGRLVHDLAAVAGAA